ncbi:diaminopimelate epimerase [Capsulimonas corticalis]|uniref:Diaminopimelate epimerase n=1 Tax=Capsulimonas corticalis TaxID=2219043 RepID=A0A402D107_9BACT|nr:diaminopimelate epimerase [Capsulimonas corticalis]BDI31761.1 diaminopimelate epimerase [Capsulimonas corticalis]
MQFTKMHGIGNDFIMVDCLGEDGRALAQQARAQAVALCDRKFGIGGDGVILVLPGETVAYQMRMLNPDGSEAEMCGNGIRCFAKFLYDRGHGKDQAELPVETGAGLLHVAVQAGADGKAATVRVDMGEPVLIPALVPTTLGEGESPVVSLPIEAAGRTLLVTAVSMGNPHAVIFVDNVKDYPLEQVGPFVESHAAFPKRTNTEFIEVISENETKFRVWERGAAETLACGTGACASVVAGVLNGKTGRRVLVHLPGGDLDIEWSEADNHVYMTGAAADVFEGNWVG